MERFEVLGKMVYVNPENGDFSLDANELLLMPFREISPAPVYSYSLYKCMTFCLEISDACNLRCTYCFNQDKSGAKMSYETAVQALDLLFGRFCQAEKYFIDLSGAGEPLLNLPLIDKIARYAREKSDEIDREATVCLVCNGTLFLPSVARHLQSIGVLFGVSLDGEKANHDANRMLRGGEGSYDQIIKNIRGIENKRYVGCAVTITKEAFPLVEALDELSKDFMTISIKPVRSQTLGFDSGAVKTWVAEYERLERKLELDLRRGDTSLLFKLINGDDYFGKFILRSFLNVKALSRCDASCGRVAVAVDGSFYPCPALMTRTYKIGDVKEGFRSDKAAAHYAQQIARASCFDCCFRFACGGECMAVNEIPNPNMCSFKKSLILLSMLLEENCRAFGNDVYGQIVDFCLEKRNRSRENPLLREFRLLHPQLSFTETKHMFDQEKPAY